MDELDELLEWLVESYSDSILYKYEIGRSYENRAINAYVLMETEGIIRESIDDLDNELKKR